MKIEPCRDDEQVRAYIDQNWSKGHILSRDMAMFKFQYRTPFVEHAVWGSGSSIMCAYNGDDLVGFIGAIVKPGGEYWLSLWHVMPHIKGKGVGGELLRAMESRASWIGTFGAGPQARPVYAKRGYAVRGVKRWVYEPADDDPRVPIACANAGDQFDGQELSWVRYRFGQHPRFRYMHTCGCISRTERNAWGTVTHIVRQKNNESEIDELYHQIRGATDGNYLMDCWAYDCPGRGWRLAAVDLPSVFHPPEVRGSVLYAVGKPFLPPMIHKGDCDQDRPN